jgi:hypothetical protein
MLKVSITLFILQNFLLADVQRDYYHNGAIKSEVHVLKGIKHGQSNGMSPIN